jgi:hypothetical protein
VSPAPPEEGGDGADEDAQDQKLVRAHQVLW